MNNFISKLLNNFRSAEQEAEAQAAAQAEAGADASDAPAADAVQSADAGLVGDLPDSDVDLTGFVQHVVGALVDSGAQWAVDTETEGSKLTVRIQCQEGQVGRIIGKNGKTIEAIRLLLRDAASRINMKAKVVVIEGT